LSLREFLVCPTRAQGLFGLNGGSSHLKKPAQKNKRAKIKKAQPGTQVDKGDGVFSNRQHSKFDPQDRGLSKLQKNLQRFFPERQLIVRSGERMRTLRLSSNRQAVIVAFVLIAGGWTLLSSGLAMSHGERIRAKNVEIKDARVGYEQLLAQVSIYKERVGELTGNLERNYSKSLALVDKESDLLEKRAAELGGPGVKRAGLVAKIASKAKGVVTDPVSTFSGESGNVELALSRAKLERGHADDERRHLLSELSDLEDSMVDVVGHHQKTPFIATDRLELRQVVLQRDMALSEKDDLSERVVALESQIREMESNDLLLYHRFSEVTETKISDIQNSLATTGLDIEMLVKRQNSEKGKGGPLMLLDPRTQRTGPLEESLNLLNSNVDYLQDLQRLVERLPIDTPLPRYQINDPFGVRHDPFTGKLAQHNGVDLGSNYKDEVLSTGDGKVIHVDMASDYGRNIIVDHGMGLQTRYAHLARFMVKEGDKVERGSVIGQLGCSGRCTGPHVHYEVLYNGNPVNPLKFMKAGKNVFKSE
jgi:murein DD-endopeptidase MepM/ murein hydrolase activator NlpD